MTSNDAAWSVIFEKLPILESLSEKTPYVITAKQINEIGRREARLMAKFDTRESLPSIFKEFQLNITATSNGSYIIFKDTAHGSFIDLPDYKLVTPSKFRPNFEFELKTLTFSAKMSESNAIDYAHHAGILSQYSGEETLKLTTRGRFFSDPFVLKSPGWGEINIKGVQIEVDAGYEGREQFLILEAKSSTRSNFNVRQLYYPYMHFSARVNKRIRTILLFFSNGVYYFTEIKFGNGYREYEILGTAAVEVEIAEAPFNLTLAELLSNCKAVTGIPVPQADDLNKVIDLLSYLANGDADKSEIAQFFEFDERQGDYYANAALYIGLVSRNRSLFSLTDAGKEIVKAENKTNRNLLVAKAILQTSLFNDLFQLYLRQNRIITDEQIIVRLEEEGLTGSTPKRRKSTTKSWLHWVASTLIDAELIPYF